MLRYVTTKILSGLDIPVEVYNFTRPNGMMRIWLKSPQNLTAVVAYVHNKPVAWACYYINTRYHMESPVVPTVGTFVPQELRSNGLGAMILDELLAHLGSSYPKVEVYYGAPIDSAHFNSTYDRLIRKHGLKPVPWYVHD